MENENFSNQTVEQKLEAIYVILKTIQMNQQNELTNIQKNHATNMKRISKLQEYNQIADMTNQIFEIRIKGIEEALKQLNSSLVRFNNN